MAAQGQNAYALMSQAHRDRWLIAKVQESTDNPLKLGTSRGAQTYTPYFPSGAIDPHRGAIAVWTQLKDGLTDGFNTIQTAMNNYRQTDSGTPVSCAHNDTCREEQGIRRETFRRPGRHDDPARRCGGV
jgi:hypothetical protein